jgi:hypothetical protein
MLEHVIEVDAAIKDRMAGEIERARAEMLAHMPEPGVVAIEQLGLFHLVVWGQTGVRSVFRVRIRCYGL